MKCIPGAALAALLLLSMTACTSGHKAEADAATTSVTTTADAANTTAASMVEASAAPADAQNRALATVEGSNSDGDKPGVGHVSMTGGYTLEHDFVVDMCQTGPPGDGLLSGYHMAVKSGDPQIGLLSIALKNYDKDGSYQVPSPSRGAAVGQAMTSGVMGPLTLMVMHEGNSTPLGFMQIEASKMTITVSDNGAKGTAAFTDLESQPDMSEYDPKSGKMPAGKRASGSISWTCGTVGRLNAKMNDAVNGAFKQLIPGK